MEFAGWKENSDQMKVNIADKKLLIWGNKMNWKLFLTATKKNFAKLNEEIPETFNGFNAMGKEAKKNGVLSEKTKELIALGIAIATRCESCVGLHIESLIRLGITKNELTEALSMCSYMGGGPSLAYSAKALECFHELSKDGNI